MRHITLASFILQLTGIVYSNQPVIYPIHPGHQNNAEKFALFRYATKFQCVLTCRQNNSCVAVNIRSSGDTHVCDLFASFGFLIEDAGTTCIGLCFYLTANKYEMCNDMYS